MRDLETISIAITAAETGHLVDNRNILLKQARQARTLSRIK